jgi:hypothetical protein
VRRLKAVLAVDFAFTQYSVLRSQDLLLLSWRRVIAFDMNTHGTISGT